MKILITGVGGDIGSGVVRILRESFKEFKIIGTDLKLNCLGQILCDKYYSISNAENNTKKWKEDLKKIILKEKIDIFLPTTESEIIRTPDLNLPKKIKTLVNDNELVKTCIDKHLCLKYLKENNIEVPLFGLLSKKMDFKIPIIIKPRAGRGSREIKKIFSQSELDEQIQIHDGQLEKYVWQELLEDDDKELTCALIKTKTNELRILQIRRTLNNGFTDYGKVVDYAQVGSYLEKVASVLKFEGLMNVQLRIKNKHPMLFEINPRVSSTVVFRHKLGFKDLKWWVDDLIGNDVEEYKKDQVGRTFYRGVQEYLL